MVVNIANSSKETNAVVKSTIKLQDGNMIIGVLEPVGKGPGQAYPVEVTYNGKKVTYLSHDDFGTSDVKGNCADMFNLLLQELFIDGSIKLK